MQAVLSKLRLGFPRINLKDQALDKLSFEIYVQVSPEIKPNLSLLNISHFRILNSHGGIRASRKIRRFQAFACSVEENVCGDAPTALKTSHTKEGPEGGPGEKANPE